MKQFSTTDINEVISILNQTTDSSWDIENSKDPENSHVIEYPEDPEAESIWWSWGIVNGKIRMYC